MPKLNDLGRTLLAQLYEIVTGGDDSVPRSKDNFFSWCLPGIPYMPEDFIFCVKGFAAQDAQDYKLLLQQAFNFAKTTIEKECNGVSDNPLFFPEQDQILFGGNLHGESTAMCLDFLAIAVSELANISERRTYQLLSGQRGLPSFLIKRPGLNSGFMIVQYTSAALVNENKVLSHPASVDTIPTCQLQEDHVSMGGTSAYKLTEIVDNCEYILAIELLTAAQAIELNQGLKLSPVAENLMRDLRRNISFLDKDRVMSDDMETARTFFQEHRKAIIANIN